MNIKLYIGSELADYNESFNVTYSIGDIRELSFGSCNKSYTLNLPLTKTNKRLLKFISQTDVKSEPTATGRLYLGELLIISGKIIILNKSGNFMKVIINSDDWMDSLKNTKMTALDLSASDHTYDHATVENSWTASYPVYRYPMIDFGGIVSGEYGAAAKWYPNDFIPAISVSHLFTKILYPYTISSTFLSSTCVKNLYILANMQVASDAFIKGKSLLVGIALDTANENTESIPAESSGNSVLSNIPVVFGVVTTDEGNDFSSDRYTVSETGTYKFKTSLKFKNNVAGYGGITITNEQVSVSIKRTRGATTDVLATISSAAYSATELINDVVYACETQYYHCEAGDEIFVEVFVLCNINNTTLSPVDVTVAVAAADSSFENVWSNVNKHAGIGKIISLEELLPDITQLDFLAAIRDIFNLRFWMDKMKRIIYIEPWDQFISSTVVDITSLIDWTSEDAEFISESYFKTIRLKFKEDSPDAAFPNYLKSHLLGPGYKDVTLTSEFVKNGEDVRENPFSTIVTGKNYAIDNITDVPRIWNTEPVYPYNIFDRISGFNTRIVEWKGMTAGFTWNFETESKSTYPKIDGLDFATIYTTYWQKLLHYIDKGKLLPVKIKINPIYLSQFITVIATAESEGFRPTYKINNDQFILQKNTTDGNIAELELILKL
jgi:hypothetical protein